MRLFTLKLVVFSGLTAGLVFLIDLVVLKAAGVYKQGGNVVVEVKREFVREGVIQHQPGVANILFLGDSHTLFGIDALTFDKLMQNRTYSWNAALPGEPIGPLYFLLTDYLRRNPPPEFLVLNLYFLEDGSRPSYFDVSGLEGANFPEEAISYFLNRKDKTLVWNYLHPIRIYRPETLKFLRNSLFNREDIRQAKNSVQEERTNNLENRGTAGYDAELAEGTAAEAPDPADIMDLRKDPYIKKFFDLTRERNIPVLLIETPVLQGFFQQRTAIPPYYQELRSRYPNVFQAESGWKFKYYPNNLFFDSGHLNMKGAQVFTKEIYSEFQEVFGDQLRQLGQRRRSPKK